MHQGSPLLPIIRSVSGSLHRHTSAAQGHIHTHLTQIRPFKWIILPICPQSSIAEQSFQCTTRLFSSFILCNTSVSHSPSATFYDTIYLKQQSTSSWFSLTCIWPEFAYFEHLLTLLLPTSTLNFFRIPYQTNPTVYTISPLSQPLVLYDLQLTSGLSQTFHHWRVAVSALSQAPKRSGLALNHPYLPETTMQTLHNPASIQH